MADWWAAIAETSITDIGPGLLMRLMTALVLGFVINFIYNRTRRPDGYAGTFPTTLVLLCVLIAMVTQVIGDNVARAFSLVGALSIVRFRTVVRDTKDTAFVIFAVVVGMAVGAGQLWIAICGIAVIGLAAAILRDRNGSRAAFDDDTLLIVRLSWSPSLEASLLELIRRHTSVVDTVAVATVRQGAAMDLTYRIRFLPTTQVTGFVAELNRVEGVQTVELQTQKPMP